ncbi:hypothetical protein NW752_010333 [Fusarium irregulare]|uniref:Protein kinase domain-containing protein n=1 Tax=Fusarium irregulare TaxID=2494466 RepID=A0A9W8PIM0_9HYPO|nr:hypothetical protein NW752_010333 [Fusarium irregulare]KAJ4007970.1 hypothetical protein NW766_009784 [Fusarium irregulare]
MATEITDATDIIDIIYQPGDIIHLRANNSDGDRNPTLQVKVQQQTRPWTLSCVMMVSIEAPSDCSQNPNKDSDAFLKMFDRRGAQQLRQAHEIDAWTEDIEQTFVTGLGSGEVDELLEKLRTILGYQHEREEEWNVAENEAFLAEELRKSFDAEVATYARLKEYQGGFIPRLLTAVTLEVTPPHPILSLPQQEFYRTRGLLLQYLQGFSLRSLVDNAPKESWQDIVDQAIRIVHILDDHEIINYDVRPANFMVVPKNGNYEVFMVDFGQCRLREEDESDEQWGLAKWTADEEGAVGHVMRMILKRAGFQLSYEPSLRYLAWAPGEDD